jgi:hypothetical protein
MEAPQLRPLGVGDIVDRVFNLYRQRPGPLLVLSTVPYLALILGLGILVLSFGSALGGFGPVIDFVNRNPRGAPVPPGLLTGLGEAASALIGFLLLAILVAIVLFATQTAAVIKAMVAQYLGKPMTVGAAFAAGLRASPRIILAGLLVFLAFIGLWIALGAAFVWSNNGIVVGLGIIGGLVATVFIFVSWVVVPCVVTVEGTGPVHALRRSWALSHGNRWRILGLQLLLLILQFVLSALLTALSVAAFAFTDQVVRFVIQQLANFAAQIIWVPIQWGATAILYLDLRVRHEGFDLQLAAEALPREA